MDKLFLLHNEQKPKGEEIFWIVLGALKGSGFLIFILILVSVHSSFALFGHTCSVIMQYLQVNKETFLEDKTEIYKGEERRVT